VINLFADLAVAAGRSCVRRSDHHNAKRDEWLERAEFWADVAKWLRAGGTKTFNEIRDRRKAVK
jgi:hypothetical protein